MVVDGPLPPMVWSGWRPMLLVPQRIVESIDPSQRRLLLLHELLHIRRGDHLIRWFAVAVLALYWWNPFAWWAVRRLQNAEEECCDAAVLSFHPHDSEIYGEALLAVSEFVSCGSLPAAAVTIGVERKNHLKRRMTMILKESGWTKLTKTRLAAVIGCGAVVLGVSLTLAASQTEPPIESYSRAQAPPSTFQATSEQPSEAAGHLAAAAKNSQHEPAKRPRGVETKPAAERLPAWMTAQPVGGAGDDELHKLLEDRYNSALKSLHAHVAKIEIDSKIPAAPVVAAARTLLDAELAITTAADTFTLYQRYVEFLRYFDDLVGKRWAAKTIGAAEFNAVHEARLDAEIKVRRHVLIRASPAWLTAKALESAPGDDELRKLLKERYNSALKTLHALLAQIEIDSNVRITALLAAARTLRDDELAIATTPAEAFGVRQRYVEVLSHLSGLISRPRANAIGADEINALVDAQKDAEPMRRNFSRQKSPARSTSSTTGRKESLPATQAAVIASEPQPELLKAKPLEPAPGDHPLQKLFKDRYNAALKSLQGQYERAQIDAAMPMVTITLAAAGRTLLDAELALSSGKDNVPLYERYLELTKFFEGRAAGLLKAKIAGPADFDAAREARLDAEIKLMQAKYMTSPRPRRTGANVQALEVRVRIAEAEVNAARAAHDQSQSEMKRALANLKYRQLQLDRIQSLRRRKAASAEDVDGATHARDEAAATVETARAAIQAAEAQGAIKLAQLEQVKMELQQARSGEGK
jgi:hypothetical protein